MSKNNHNTLTVSQSTKKWGSLTTWTWFSSKLLSRSFLRFSACSGSGATSFWSLVTCCPPCRRLCLCNSRCRRRRSCSSSGVPARFLSNLRLQQIIIANNIQNDTNKMVESALLEVLLPCCCNILVISMVFILLLFVNVMRKRM
jgi:hypothetical protein